ncbi:MAG: hypothetical protein RMJ43_01550 [Chloroherpetonaceae bacterium]|nr:hypothetical protein [Chloroherpetonaceae bacterium]
MRKAFLPGILLVAIGWAGCTSDRDVSLPSRTGDPFANRIDPENPPPPAPPAPARAQADPMPDETEVGIAFYPNAKPFKDRTGAEASHVRGEGMLTVILETTDPMDRVVDFYAKRMPAADRTEQEEQGKRVVNLSELYDGNGVRMVSITQEAERTRITLQNVRPLAGPAESRATVPPSGGGALPEARSRTGNSAP